MTYDLNLLPERIRSKIKIDPSGCWLWTGCIVPSGARQGYGRVKGLGYYGPPYIWMSHRLVYTFFRGPIAPGWTLDHLIESNICMSTLCCNPAHLEQVTRGDNLRRSPQTIAGAHVRKTRCPAGHSYAEGNLRVAKQYDGSTRKARICKQCHAITEQRRRDRLRAVNAP